MFGAGIAAGIGIGIAIGMSAGAKQARDKLSEYCGMNGVTLSDRHGKSMPVDDVLDQALCTVDPKQRKAALVLLAIGLAVTASLGVLVFFWARG